MSQSAPTEVRAVVIATGLAPTTPRPEDHVGPSPKQRDFIRALQARVLPNGPQSDDDLLRLTKQEASELIDVLKAKAPPTDKQANFWRTLSTERGYDPVRLEAEAKVLGTWTAKDISTAINSLKGQPKTTVTTATGQTVSASTVPTPPAVSEGEVHKRTDGTLVRVFKSRRTGGLYGKTRQPGEEGWTYEGRVLQGLGPATLLTPEEARSLGARFGICAICGRKLTVEESIRNGIGPVCGKRVTGWSNPASSPAKDVAQVAKKIVQQATEPLPPAVAETQAKFDAIAQEISRQAVMAREAAAKLSPWQQASLDKARQDVGSSASLHGSGQATDINLHQCPWSGARPDGNGIHLLKLEGQAHGWDGPTCGRCGGALLLDKATGLYHADHNRAAPDGRYKSEAVTPPKELQPPFPTEYQAPSPRERRQAPKLGG